MFKNKIRKDSTQHTRDSFEGVLRHVGTGRVYVAFVECIRWFTIPSAKKQVFWQP